MSGLEGHSAETVAQVPWRRLSRRSVLGGLTIAAVVMVIGVALLGLRSGSWTVHSSLLILPTEVAAQADGAGYYDTLSQGKIVETFAEVIQTQSAPRLVPISARLTDDQESKIKVTVTAVPNTSIIDITVEAPTARQAGQVANSVAEASLGTLQQLGTPYRASVISPAEPALAKAVGPSLLVLGFVIVVVAVLAGVGAQQVLWLVGAVTARGSMSRTSTGPPQDPADQSLLKRTMAVDGRSAVGAAARPLE